MLRRLLARLGQGALLSPDYSDLRPPSTILDQAQIGGGDFAVVGEHFVGALKDLAGLQPTHSVLDVGCGAGRIATALTHYLVPPGKYEGFDPGAAGVGWCQRELSTRFSHFRFQHIDVANGTYNPTGKVSATTLRFPYADSEFDAVILISVFTHLLPDVVSWYLRESHRVLRPGGRLFGTWFLWQTGASSEASEMFPVDLGDYRVGSIERPEAVVAFSSDMVRAAYSAADLSIDVQLAGNWIRGNHTLPYQDVIVATRR